jgi:hypothetical protein
MVPSIIPLSVVEGRSRVAWLRTKASALPDAFLDAFFVFVFLDFPDAFFPLFHCMNILLFVMAACKKF